MVFEQIIGSHWIEKKPYFAFLIGVFFTVISILSALLIFGSNPGYMIVAFITLLLTPTLSVLLRIEMNQELREKRFNLFHMIRDHADIFQVYFFLFMGIFCTVFLVCLMLPVTPKILSPGHIFQPQLNMGPNLELEDGASFKGEMELAFRGSVDSELFMEYLRNNTIVLIVCFALSFFYGAGSFLFLTWNATTWGAIFGVQFRSAFNLASFPAVLPHMMTETLAYLGAAIAGGIVSKAVVRENLSSKKFNHILIDGFIFLGLSFIAVVIGAFFEASLIVQ